ncbi:type IV toxin-antitoxin system AbiEi family antitoxin domain-containing protein [Mycobacterium yunnanensis]|uniref:Type IV toxin-antitoxin system AbiEi family antitoxin domain-containing protein n=1 Tax=Mycobacterium yunnanensis TaxID=368477 RepID=A0A9X2Z451_9MYCO|nr:type IV toxin-antitoxin system AbiEi family antitoxin domain-containing protein [Mycobacterium yunnanensis]MCV7421547.1 type IV toxin-antitoxin system AbiEi family antitoxin domain-containing protein [Mycobacterium yunnanensis]
MDLDEVFGARSGLATTADLASSLNARTLALYVEAGAIVRVCHGVYALRPPDLEGRLAAFDLMTGRQLVACMNTAAALYGFDIENDDRVHVVDPGIRMRPNASVMVHQRVGGPLRRVGSRLATAPAWTAVEMARTLRPPRALAVLDAALRSGTCTVADLRVAIARQGGRRGIVRARDLLEHADGRAESPMESEARLVFIDGGLPLPELQSEIVDRGGALWRADFLWSASKLVAEYDSMQWHASPEALRHDRMKTARLQECGYRVVPLVVDDVRRWPGELVARIASHLSAA